MRDEVLIRYVSSLDGLEDCDLTSVGDSEVMGQDGYALLYMSGRSGAEIDNLKGFFIPTKEYF